MIELIITTCDYTTIIRCNEKSFSYQPSGPPEATSKDLNFKNLSGEACPLNTKFCASFFECPRGVHVYTCNTRHTRDCSDCLSKWKCKKCVNSRILLEFSGTRTKIPVLSQPCILGWLKAMLYSSIFPIKLITAGEGSIIIISIVHLEIIAYKIFISKFSHLKFLSLSISSNYLIVKYLCCWVP